jgi:hypothetical protein
MAWTHTQDAPEVQATSTTITPTFGSATAVGSLLIAYLIAPTAADSWTLPAGWVQGPNVTNTACATIWYYIGNPGGITSVLCTFGGTQNIKGVMSEFGAIGTPTVNATGSGTAGATTSCTATSSSGTPATGDLDLVCFAWKNATASAVTWTTPSGWTLAGDDTASGGNHIWAGYVLSGASGTLSVVGTTNNAAQDWAGALMTFTNGSSSTNANAGLAAATATGQAPTPSVSLQMTVNGM